MIKIYLKQNEEERGEEEENVHLDGQSQRHDNGSQCPLLVGEQESRG